MLTYSTKEDPNSDKRSSRMPSFEPWALSRIRFAAATCSKSTEEFSCHVGLGLKDTGVPEGYEAPWWGLSVLMLGLCFAGVGLAACRAFADVKWLELWGSG